MLPPMRYGEITFGTFIDRPNRFIAHVEAEGAVQTVHVKNTGRCRELLVPGVRVVLERATNPNRKTPFDLVAVYKNGDWLFNIDSQAPNKVMGEWLATQDYDVVRPEFTFGASRVDFMMERDSERFLMEVKGCTLERDGIGYFPDAPTERGVKHLRELAGAATQGWNCSIAFVLPEEGVHEARPNMETHPAFGEALQAAQAAGVEVLFAECAVTPQELRITKVTKK